MPDEANAAKEDLGQDEIPEQLGLTPEQAARLDLVQRRCMAESGEVNPNLVDTAANVRAHGFMWCRGRRINRP